MSVTLLSVRHNACIFFRSIYIFRVSPSPSKLVSYSLFRLLVILVLVIVLVIVLVLVVVILIVIAVEDLKTQLPALERAEQKLHLVYIGKLEPWNDQFLIRIELKINENWVCPPGVLIWLVSNQSIWKSTKTEPGHLRPGKMELWNDQFLIKI